jgi:hypothetical protein
VDGMHFDRLLRGLTTARSRRSALLSLFGGGIGLLGIEATSARHHKKHKKKHHGRGSPPVSPPPVSPPPSPPVPPSPPAFCAGKNECVTMDASCAAAGGAEQCFCFVRADAGHAGESFCAGEAGAGPVATCDLCPVGEVCVDFSSCGGGLGCRQACSNPI